MRLIVLDIENTIITGYKPIVINGLLPAIIDPELKNILKTFAETGQYLILIATGTDGENIERYKKEFTKNGIHQYISAYQPEQASEKDRKKHKLEKYHNQYKVMKNDMYYYDDAEPVIESTKAAGFKNSFVVTPENSLVKQLQTLAFAHGLTTQRSNHQSSGFFCSFGNEDDDTNLSTNHRPGSCTLS